MTRKGPRGSTAEAYGYALREKDGHRGDSEPNSNTYMFQSLVVIGKSWAPSSAGANMPPCTRWG